MERKMDERDMEEERRKGVGNREENVIFSLCENCNFCLDKAA
jgi:hypothetical protein